MRRHMYPKFTKSYQYSWLVLLILLLLGIPTGIKAQDSSSRVRSISWNEDGSKIAFSHNDGTIEIQSTVTSQTLFSFQADGDGATSSVAFGRDVHSDQLASGGADGVVRIWDANTGELIQSFTGYDIIESVDWNPVYPNILASVNSLGLIKIWDIRTRYLIFSEGRAEYAFGLKWSPDGKQLVTTNGIALVIVTLNADNDAKFSTLLPRDMIHVGLIGTVDWGMDPKIVISGTANGKLTAWDATSGLELKFFGDGFEAITSTQFSPDGSKIACVGYDGRLRIWDFVTAQLIRAIPIEYASFAVAWSPDGNQIAYGADVGTVQILSLTDALTPPTAAPP